MALERQLSFLTSIIIACTLGLGGWIVYSDGRANLEASEAQQIGATSLVLTTAMNQAESLTVSHSQLLAHDPDVIALMKAADRPGLQLRMKPVLDRLTVDAGIDVLHFQTPDMKSFLRVWSPDDFGQDLSRIRPMVLTANKSRAPQKGLEIGMKGLSLRAVSAVEQDGALLGTVEVGVSLKTLLELAKSSTGADFAIYLDPQFIPDGKGASGDTAGALRLDASTNTELFAALQARGLVRLVRAPDSTVASMPGSQLGILNRPLLDYSGKMIGVLIVSQDFTALEESFRATLVTIAVVSLAGLLVAYGVLMVTLRALVFRPLERLAADCAEGDISDPTTTLVSYLRIHRAILAHPRLKTGDPVILAQAVAPAER